MAKPKKIPDESIKTLETILKRKLTTEEIRTGKLDRQPKKLTMPPPGSTDEELERHVFNQPFNVGPFRPVAKSANADDDPYAEMIVEAEREIEQERWRKLTPAEQKLWAMKSAQAELAQQQAEKATLAAHLAKHADTLKALRDLADSVELDPHWVHEDLQAIENAISQIEFGPNADVATTKKLLADVVQVKAKKLQEKKDDLAVKLADAGLGESEIAAIIEKRFAEQVTPEVEPVDKSKMTFEDRAADAKRIMAEWKARDAAEQAAADPPAA
jgi:hypothetical protein